jgi:CSLREA domain-containing protein
MGRAPKVAPVYATALALAVMLILLLAPARAGAATFGVNSLADPGDGTCDASCTLRDAMTAANANPGADSITFSVAGTITLLSELPQIGQELLIDGETAPGWSEDSPVVELSVNGAGFRGLWFGGAVSGGGVRGLVIHGQTGYQIETVAGSSNITISGNFIGTDVSGTSTEPALGAGTSGLYIAGSGHTIGGTGPGDGNLISGGYIIGITQLQLNGSNHEVYGNYIGTDVTGTVDLVGNGSLGMSVNGTGHSIGGTAPGQANLISGNNAGIFLYPPPPPGPTVTVAGNLIGTDATGSVALGNTLRGIQVTAAGPSLFEISDNLVSGNDVGILVDGADGGLLTGNKVGTNLAGTGSIPNVSHGVYLAGGASDVAISGGKIANNGGDGIRADAGTEGNTFHNLSISNNAGLGIDLNLDGVTANDNLDLDTGANGLQNFPVLTSSITTGADNTTEGSISTNAAVTAVTIDFFSVATCDPSGHGEGAVYEGSTIVNTDPAGNATFSQDLPAFPTSGFVTATATTASGTSEFSACGEVEFIPPPDVPEPENGKRAVAAPVRGSVFVTRPGGRKLPLQKGEEIPVGSVLDTTRGTVRITTAVSNGTGTQTAEFYAGTFRLLQSRGQTLTTVVLTGGKKRSKSCKAKRPKRKATRSFGIEAGISVSQSSRTLRKLWGKGKGKFQTKGSRGSATVRGTQWLTADRCDGTFFKVREGVVGIKDFGKKNKKIVLRKGKTYLAKAPR